MISNFNIVNVSNVTINENCRENESFLKKTDFIKSRRENFFRTSKKDNCPVFFPKKTVLQTL